MQQTLKLAQQTPKLAQQTLKLAQQTPKLAQQTLELPQQTQKHRIPKSYNNNPKQSYPNKYWNLLFF
ncbi:hypothetical protein ACQKM9_00745 [Viridibacillus sp. NPDC093762]|uniref:hypothetical protein n=1 Tax=Viridibacillus sp. NPDC093762 TaxID=3390720 RepID=UPI003CFD5C40